ncbi:hypothetical protein JXL19_09150 [bacterium]|nr:hypothetical protein [bacterium]
MREGKKRLLITLSICSLLVALASKSYSWNDSHTHPGITTAVIDNLLTLNKDYFKENLGDEYALDMQIKMDKTIVDAKASQAGSGGNRFNNLFYLPAGTKIPFAGPALLKTKGRLFTILKHNDFQSMPYKPTGSMASGGNDAIASLKNWILVGSALEDKPNIRARNHFYGYNDNNGMGLDNAQYFSFLYVPKSLYPLLLIEGMDGTGLSSYIWATSDNNSQMPNAFSYRGFNTYYYKAFIDATSKDERETFLSLAMLSLGHTIHLFEDAGVPAHVRNDFVTGHLQEFGFFDWANPFEHYIEKKYGLDLSSGKLSGYASAPSFSNLLDAWDNLSNYSRDNFFSFQSTPFGFYHYFSQPDISSTVLDKGQTNASSHQKYFLFRGLPSGAPAGISSDPRGYKLATIRYLGKKSIEKILKVNINTSIDLQNILNDPAKMNIIRLASKSIVGQDPLFSVDDTDVQSDYAELIIPKVRASVEGLFDYVFRAKLGAAITNVSFDPSTNDLLGVTVSVKNLSTDPDASMNNGDVIISYEYGNKTSFGKSNKISGAAIPTNSYSDFVFTFNNPVPQSALYDPTLKFYFAYKGEIGQNESIIEDPNSTVIKLVTLPYSQIKTSGGDAYLVAQPGNGGNVTIMSGAPGSIPSFPPAGYLLIINYGETISLSGSHNFHSIDIYGKLQASGDLLLYSETDINLYPGGEIIASGNSPNVDGYNIELYAEGDLNLLGNIDASGANGDSSCARGGKGGNVTIITSSINSTTNVISLGSIITRGGDADDVNYSSGNVFTGGKGGDITIIANTGHISFMSAISRPPERDTLPVPPPYNLGPCNCNGSTCDYIRPNAGERLPLLPAGDSLEPLEFKGGLLTSGGMGGYPENRYNPGSAGGKGGNIRIECLDSIGHISFNGADLYTGANVETVCSKISVYLLGYKTYQSPTGCLGGRGSISGTGLSAGDGGQGGNAGNITVTGILFPPPANINPLPVKGYNGENPNHTSYRNLMGYMYEAYDTSNNLLYRVNAIGGSGGIPSGGSGSTFPGYFGYKGNDGTVTGLPPY